MEQFPFELHYDGEKATESAEFTTTQAGEIDCYISLSNCSQVRVHYKSPDDADIADWHNFVVRPLPIQDGVLPIPSPKLPAGSKVKVVAHIGKRGYARGAITVADF